MTSVKKSWIFGFPAKARRCARLLAPRPENGDHPASVLPGDFTKPDW
jgi:hypothetical protein